MKDQIYNLCPESIPHHLRKASACKNLFLPFGEFSPIEVYDMIRSNAFRMTTEAIRSLLAEGKVPEADNLKRQQYGFTPSSRWSSTRRESNVIEITGNVIVEADHLSPDELELTAQLISADNYAFMGFVTSSGSGYKWLVATNATTIDEHREVYRQLCKYYSEKFPKAIAEKLDVKQPDPVRLMFLSCDQSSLAFFKTEYKVFKFTAPVIVKQDNVSKTPAPIAPISNNSSSKLEIAAKMIRDAQDGEKHNTLLRASILAGGFVGGGLVSEDEAISVLENEIACKEILCMKTAQKTIRDGISYGRRRPIFE